MRKCATLIIRDRAGFRDETIYSQIRSWLGHSIINAIRRIVAQVNVKTDDMYFPNDCSLRYIIWYFFYLILFHCDLSKTYRLHNKSFIFFYRETIRTNCISRETYRYNTKRKLNIYLWIMGTTCRYICVHVRSVWFKAERYRFRSRYIVINILHIAHFIGISVHIKLRSKQGFIVASRKHNIRVVCIELLWFRKRLKSRLVYSQRYEHHNAVTCERYFFNLFYKEFYE